MTKLLLDVDGVLNVFPPEFRTKYDDWHRFNAHGYWIHWSESVCSRLNSLPVEIHWLTTWQEDANKYIGQELGWPQYPVLSNIQRTEMLDANWWKLPYAQKEYDAGHSIIWLDDDIVFSPEALEWLETTDRDRLLTISPEYGLTHEHLDHIEQWLGL